MLTKLKRHFKNSFCGNGCTAFDLLIWDCLLKCVVFFKQKWRQARGKSAVCVCVCEVNIYLEKLTDVPPSCENLCLRMSLRCVQHLCFDASSVFICHVSECVFVDGLQQADGRGVWMSVAFSVVISLWVFVWGFVNCQRCCFHLSLVWISLTWCQDQGMMWSRTQTHQSWTDGADL